MQLPVAANAAGVAPRSFYKRNLPCPPAIAFSSVEGKQLFAEALAGGSAQGFFKLIEQFRTQDEPAFCGLASLAMVLNALAVDPRRPWKGPWRWFHEQMLDCCRPLSEVIKTGVTLDQVACLARCNGATADLHRHSDCSEDSFRATVQETCTSEQQHVIVSYSRKQFLQTGDGHFSPIGAYHAGQDLVLILDTARFKYPPHWVPLKQLYAAMACVDVATNKPRGFIAITPKPCMDSVMFTLDGSSRAWAHVDAFLTDTLPKLLETMPSQTAFSTVDQASPPCSPISTQPHVQQTEPLHSTTVAAAAAIDVLEATLDQIPKDAVLHLLTVRPTVSNCCSSAASACVSPAAVAHFLEELRSLETFASIHRWCSTNTDTQRSCIDEGSLREELPHVQPNNLSPSLNQLADHNLRVSTDPVIEGAIDSSLANSQTAQQPTAHVTNPISLSAAPDVLHANDVAAPSQRQSPSGPTPCCSKATAAADRTSKRHQKSSAASTLDTAELIGSAKQCCSTSSADKVASGPENRQCYIAEAICMFLFLVPKAVWDGIPNTQVRQMLLKLVDVPPESIVASEVKYLANQWAELPELQQAEGRIT